MPVLNFIDSVLQASCFPKAFSSSSWIWRSCVRRASAAPLPPVRVENSIQARTRVRWTTAAPPVSEAEDLGQLAKILFARLVDVEPVDHSELARLADARAQAIVSELTEAGQIPAERVQVKSSAAMDKGGAVTAELTLDARQ